MDIDKQNFLKRIQSNIDTFGYHLTIVTGKSPLPRYVYSIGLTEKIGFELVFAGDGLLNYDDLKDIFDEMILNNKTKSSSSFYLTKVDNSWSKLMMLGVYDFYKTSEFEAMQIMPDSKSMTLDIPAMSIEYNENDQTVWKWLTAKWIMDVPSDSIVITNSPALFGEKITEATRWEENEWEAFVGAGPEAIQEDIRIIPLGVLIGIDSSTMALAKLKICKGIYREETDLVWKDWN